MDDAAKMQGAAAMAGGVQADQVAVASTGVIGVPLDTRAVVSGLARAPAPSCAPTATATSARRS